MRNTRDKLGFRLLAAGALLTVLLTACGSKDSDATPTLGVDAIFTAAFQTLEAQQATQLALTPPTETPSPSPFPTLPPPSPISTIPFSTSPAGGGTACDKATFVTDVTIPDNTTMAAGQKFVKTWRLINQGTCTWSTSYKLAFESGEAMGGATSFVSIPVPPGNQGELSVNLTAPTANGNYTGTWRMRNANDQAFGDFITVVIKVGGGPTATAGPSPTAGAGDVIISGNAEYPDVKITYVGTGSNPSGETTADGSGDYSFSVPSGWSGTVTPSKGAYTFTPASKPYTNVTSNQTGQNYDAQ